MISVLLHCDMTFIILKERLNVLLHCQMCALGFIHVTTIRIVSCFTVAVSSLIELPLCLVYRTAYQCVSFLKSQLK